MSRSRTKKTRPIPVLIADCVNKSFPCITNYLFSGVSENSKLSLHTASPAKGIVIVWRKISYSIQIRKKLSLLLQRTTFAVQLFFFQPYQLVVQEKINLPFAVRGNLEVGISFKNIAVESGFYTKKAGFLEIFKCKGIVFKLCKTHSFKDQMTDTAFLLKKPRVDVSLMTSGNQKSEFYQRH